MPATIDEEFLARLWQPERMLLPELAGFPAHLHIDILPDHQGGGYGRRLVETFLMAAAQAGAPGVHVAVATANAAAHGFYLRVGFEAIPVAGAVRGCLLRLQDGGLGRFAAALTPG